MFKIKIWQILGYFGEWNQNEIDSDVKLPLILPDNSTNCHYNCPKDCPEIDLRSAQRLPRFKINEIIKICMHISQILYFFHHSLTNSGVPGRSPSITSLVFPMYLDSPAQYCVPASELHRGFQKAKICQN